MTEAKVPAPLIATILRERARLFEIIDNLQSKDREREKEINKIRFDAEQALLDAEKNSQEMYDALHEIAFSAGNDGMGPNTPEGHDAAVQLARKAIKVKGQYYKWYAASSRVRKHWYRR